MNTQEPKAIHPARCRFCSSRKCCTRICTDDLGFDEVACHRHIKELERLADGTLGVSNGVKRWHLTSTRTYRRGEPVGG